MIDPSGSQKRTWSAAVVVVLLLVSACGGASEPEAASPDVVEPASTPAVPATALPTAPPAPTATPTPAPTALPTAVPTPEPLTNEELIALAVATFENAPEPADIDAVDLIEGRVTDAGRVELSLCTWTGLTVFDEVRDVVYDVGSSVDGEPELTLVSGIESTDTCLNQELMQRALAFTRTFDAFWADQLANPAGFRDDPRSDTLMTWLARDAMALVLDGHVQDRTATLFTDYEQPLPESAVAPIMWRRYEEKGYEFFAIVACREMNPEYGTYRDGELVAGGRTEDSGGSHSIVEYMLTPDDISGEWQFQMLRGRLWGDCFRTGDWPDAVNQWRPEPTTWEPWQNEG